MSILKKGMKKGNVPLPLLKGRRGEI